MDICNLFNENGSFKDKNGYLQVYHILFHKMRNDKLDILSLGDSSDIWEKYFVESNFNKDGKYDIIIDSQSSIDIEHIQTLRANYSKLKDGGYYVIENISIDSKLVSCPGLISCICQNDPYIFVGLKNNICVINKSPINSKRENY